MYQNYWHVYFIRLGRDSISLLWRRCLGLTSAGGSSKKIENPKMSPNYDVCLTGGDALKVPNVRLRNVSTLYR